MVRIVVASLFVLHGLIHLFGFAKAFGVADLPLLAQSISEPVGVMWLMAAVLCCAAAAALFVTPRWWWIVGALAVVTSQVVIAASWSDAAVGTIANLLLLVAVAYGFAARGPFSLRAEFERDLSKQWPAAHPRLVTEDDLAALPLRSSSFPRMFHRAGWNRVSGSGKRLV
jgi:hypothetical protein